MPTVRTSPRYRPPASLRALIAMVAMAALLFTVALMWSDRAPGVLQAVAGPRVRDLWARVDPPTTSVTVSRSDLPRTDSMVHIAIWGTVSFLVFCVGWSWRWLIGSSIVVVLSSYAIELGQGRYSNSRHVDISDAYANTLGVIVGVGAATIVYLLWNGAGYAVASIMRVGRGKRGPRTESRSSVRRPVPAGRAVRRVPR